MSISNLSLHIFTSQIVEDEKLDFMQFFCLGIQHLFDMVKVGLKNYNIFYLKFFNFTLTICYGKKWICQYSGRNFYVISSFSIQYVKSWGAEVM